MLGEEGSTKGAVCAKAAHFSLSNTHTHSRTPMLPAVQLTESDRGLQALREQPAERESEAKGETGRARE